MQTCDSDDRKKSSKVNKNLDYFNFSNFLNEIFIFCLQSFPLLRYKVSTHPLLPPFVRSIFKRSPDLFLCKTHEKVIKIFTAREKSRKYGDPDRTRTCNPLLRRQMLYPVELRDQTEEKLIFQRIGVRKLTKDGTTVTNFFQAFSSTGT